jgi:hypothetical protein
MPDWLLALGAAIAILGFLYFAFVWTKPAPRSGDDPDRFDPHIHRLPQLAASFIVQIVAFNSRLWH